MTCHRILKLLAYPLRIAGALVFVACAAGFAAVPGYGQSDKSHEIYERACGSCHESHAGDFAHDNLALKDNKAVSIKTGRSVEDFLLRGHGNLSSEDAKELSAHLTRILQNDSLFHTHCRICHDPARLLAADKLLLEDGVLIGRYTGRNIQEFLYQHGRIDTEEAKQLTEIMAQFLLASGQN